MRKGYLIVTLALMLAVSGCGSTGVKESETEAQSVPAVEEQTQQTEETVSEEITEEEVQAEDSEYQYELPFDKNSFKVFGLSIDDLDTLDSDGFAKLLEKYEIEPQEGTYTVELGDNNEDHCICGVINSPDKPYELAMQYGTGNISKVQITKSNNSSGSFGLINEIAVTIDGAPIPDGLYEGNPMEFGASYDEVYSYLNCDLFVDNDFTKKLEEEGYALDAWYYGYKAMLRCEEGRSIALTIFEDGDIKSDADSTNVNYFFTFDGEQKLREIRIRKVLPNKQ